MIILEAAAAAATLYEPLAETVWVSWKQTQRDSVHLCNVMCTVSLSAAWSSYSLCTSATKTNPAHLLYLTNEMVWIGILIDPTRKLFTLRRKLTTHHSLKWIIDGASDE